MTSVARDSVHSEGRVDPVSNRSLLNNTAWTVLGSAAPLGVAVITIPILISRLGNDKFGVLTLAWALVGYFGLFDLGLGKALTRLVAEKVARDKECEVPGAFWCCLALLFGVGCLGSLIVGSTANWMVISVLHIPKQLQLDTVRAFYVIAATIPIVSTASGLRGYLEGRTHFAHVSVIRMLVGILGFIGPVLVLPFSKSLVAVIAALAAARAITWFGFFFCCLRVSPILSREPRIKTADLMPLMRFGGWVTVSNIVSPLMVSMDRFMVAGLASLGVVAYYVTPQEMMTKLLVLPMALQTVVFPSFSTTTVSGDAMRDLYRRGINAILLALFPITILLATFSREILTIWLGPTFALHSFRIVQWLSIGILINAVAHIPAAMIQGGDRPDLCAKLHLIELPLYALIAWGLIVKFGIEGAAAAWVLRVAFDALMLLAIARKWAPGFPFKPVYVLGGAVAIAASIYLVSAGVPVALRLAFVLTILLGTLSTGWPQLRTQIFRRA